MNAAVMRKPNFIYGIMDHHVYINILKKNLRPVLIKWKYKTISSFKIKPNIVHILRTSGYYNMPELMTPPKSPDLNQTIFMVLI